MKYIYIESLNRSQAEQIFKILCDVDEEFVPCLSSRESTTQNNLSKSSGGKNLPYAYFGKIKEQSAILAVEQNRIVGFMSFIEEYSVKLNGEDIDTLYLSTIIIEKKSRKKGISYDMYKFLINKYRDRNIITRTWSTNTGHLKLLEKLGFKLSKRIKDDRGNGIDTVYYGRRCEQ